MSSRTNQVFLPHNSPVSTRLIGYLSKEKFVLEIGCGDGALTKVLKANNFRYLGIELDNRYVQILQEQGMMVRRVDALTLSVREVESGSQIVGSLPYDQSKSIIYHLMLLTNQVAWSFGIFIIQKEVAISLTKGWWGEVMSRYFIYKKLFNIDSKAWNQNLKVDGTTVLLVNRNLGMRDLSLECSVVRNVWVGKKKKLRNNPNLKVGRISINLGVGDKRIHELDHKLRAQLIRELLLV